MEKACSASFQNEEEGPVWCWEGWGLSTDLRCCFGTLSCEDGGAESVSLQGRQTRLSREVGGLLGKDGELPAQAVGLGLSLGKGGEKAPAAFWRTAGLLPSLVKDKQMRGCIFMAD